MLLQEMMDRVVVNSGQFMLSPDALELKRDNFLLLAKQVIGVYNHYDPIEKNIYKEINGNRQYTFTETNTPSGIPEYISELVPCRIAGVYPFYLREYDSPKTNLDIKSEFPWEYRKPVLTIPIQGEYDIKAVYYHKMVQDADGNWRCDTINDTHEEFFQLLTAKFLQALGRSRAAFIMGDLPITTNADSMVAEGKEMEETAMESIRNNKHRFYLAWR